MLKNLSVCSLAAFFLISCGSNGFEESRKLGKTTRVDSEGKTLGETLREELKLADKATGSYTNGLLLTVKNSLHQHQPKLSVEICSPMENGTEYCLVNKKLIKYDQSQEFYVPVEDLKKLMGGDKKITWRFNETYSNSLIHWHCYEKPDTQIDLTKLNKADIKVTQINTASYSCRVN